MDDYIFHFLKKIKKFKLKINNLKLINKLKDNVPEEDIESVDHKEINSELRNSLKDKCLKINYLTKKNDEVFSKKYNNI